MLHHTREVTETYVDELDVLVFEVSQEFLGIGEHTSSWHSVSDTGRHMPPPGRAGRDVMGTELPRRIPIVSAVLRNASSRHGEDASRSSDTIAYSQPPWLHQQTGPDSAHGSAR
ncbi:hypothetical protein GCM10010112_54720 [Actinoplanes lobatus]|nr:hypothetical protein GCM10010112_54720 [Actinoplanes lobatus]